MAVQSKYIPYLLHMKALSICSALECVSNLSAFLKSKQLSPTGAGANPMICLITHNWVHTIPPAAGQVKEGAKHKLKSINQFFTQAPWQC